MSEHERKSDVRERTERLLNGSLKHVRAAALAAVLVPLASVAAAPVAAQDGQWSGAPPSSVPSPCDFVTSGGFVYTDTGKKVSFGAHGGCKNGEFWGHINVIDHAAGYHINSLDVTGYVWPSPDSHTRDICGTATTNAAEGQPVQFRLRLTDNGEPGTADEFGLRLSTGYWVPTRLLGGGTRGGGNVQLHDQNPSTNGPEPSPDETAMCGGLEAP